MWRYVVSDGAKVIGETVGAAEPVDIASKFPVADIIGDLSAQLATRAAHAEAALAQREADLKAEQERSADLHRRLVDAESRLKSLSRQPADLADDKIGEIIKSIVAGV